MPLLTGAWKININGTEGNLVIESIDANGNIDGVVLGVQISGFWNESAQSIFFESLQNVQNAEGTVAVARGQFTGYLLNIPGQLSPGSDLTWILSGYLKTPRIGGLAAVQPNSYRSTFGWVAEKNQVV